MAIRITDEIIDAIIQNEHRHVCRLAAGRPFPRTPWAPCNRADLRPDWIQLPPGVADDPAAVEPWPRTSRYCLSDPRR
jgi:hypothetical protein